MDKFILEEYNNFRNSTDPVACYAPRKNMYFDVVGNVYSCCFNRAAMPGEGVDIKSIELKVPMGQYPKMTLQEIWNSDSANKLRKDIDNFEFNQWCYPCRYDLENKNFEAFNDKTRVWNDTSENNNFPTHLEFELTNRCNLECIMCNGGQSSLIRKNRDKLDPIKMVYDEKFVDQLEEFIPHLQNTTFLGGEPFLINIYYTIWEKIIELNPKCNITIQTNGSILNERIKKLLNKGNFYINISLDSLNEKTYNKIRVNADFKKTYSNLEYFIEYTTKNEKTLCITPTIIRQNYLEILDFVEFANKKHIILVYNKSYHSESMRYLSNRTLKKIYNELSAYKFKENNWLQVNNKRTALSIINQIGVWSNE